MAGMTRFQRKDGELGATWVCSTQVALNSPVPFAVWRFLAFFKLVLAVKKEDDQGEN
jgi:hypothetical protein